jgi:hypothetical protein
MPVPDDERQEEADRQTRSLAGLAVCLVLVLVGLFLVQRLTAAAKLQDCVMAGRSNCLDVTNDHSASN